MDKGTPCVMETGSQARKSALAVAVSNPVHQLCPTTLDYGTGLGFQKVLPYDELDASSSSMQTFFKSGKAGYMEDQTVGLLLTEKIMPFVHSATADCALVYTKNIGIVSGRFDDHTHFEPKRRCGQGTSGEVWKYLDTKTDTSFVRKRLKDGKTLRHEEVESMLKMQHLNVCQVFAILCSGSTVDLLLQDAGYPLRDCLSKFVEMGIDASRYWKVVEDFARQGFRALVYIHRQGFCHLDIKPENILVHQNAGLNPVLVLADFGSCLPLSKKMTLHMQLTPEYWCPELWGQACKCFMPPSFAGSAAAREDIEFTCDVGFDTYAMGLVVYYMGTLQHLVQELETKFEMPDSVVTVEEVDSFIEMTGRQFPDKKLAFKMILMQKYKHLIPVLATHPSQWVRPEILATLIRVLESTLEPDRGKRWTEVDADNFLAGREQVKLALKKPTQVVDESASTKEYFQDEVMQEAVATTSNMSENSSLPCKQSFNQKMAQYRQPWDNSVRTPGGAPAFSNQKKDFVVSGIPSQNTAFVAPPDDISLRPSSQYQEPNVVVQALPVSVPATISQSGQILSKNPGHMLRLGDLDVIDLTQEHDEVDIEMATNIAVAQNLEIECLVVDEDLNQEENLLKGKTILNGQMGQLSLAKTETGFVVQGKGHSGGLDTNPWAETRTVFVAHTSSSAFDPKCRGKGGSKRCPSKSARHGGIPVKGKGSSVMKTAHVKQGVGGGRGKKVLAAAIPATRVPFLVASSTRPECVERTLEDMAFYSASAEESAGIIGRGTAEQHQSAGVLARVEENTVQSPAQCVDTETVTASTSGQFGFSGIIPFAVATEVNATTVQTPAQCVDTERVSASTAGQYDPSFSGILPLAVATEVNVTTFEMPAQCVDMDSHGLDGVDVDELLKLILCGGVLPPAISGAAAHYMPLDWPPPQIINEERFVGNENEMVVADVAVNLPDFSLLLDGV